MRAEKFVNFIKIVSVGINMKLLFFEKRCLNGTVLQVSGRDCYKKMADNSQVFGERYQTSENELS